jgi:hypothetical protein
MGHQSIRVPSRDLLRASARLQGVEPTDEDLDAVGGFLAVILPALAEIEVELEPGVPPAGLFPTEPEDA